MGGDTMSISYTLLVAVRTEMRYDLPRPLPLLLAGTPARAPTGVEPRPGADRTAGAAARTGGWLAICPPLSDEES